MNIKVPSFTVNPIGCLTDAWSTEYSVMGADAKTKSADYTILSTDSILIATSALTFTLPTASVKVILTIKAATSDNVLIQPAGADDVYADSVVTSLQIKCGQSLTIVSDGVSRWFII